MTSLLLLLVIIVSVTAMPVSKSSTSDGSNDVDSPKRLTKRLESGKKSEEPDDPEVHLHDKNWPTTKKGRMHKAFFLNYPYTPQINKHSSPTPSPLEYDVIEERSPGHRKKYQDSKIFYIRLPPSPYFFVPGMGYISNPPKFTSSSLPQTSQKPGRRRPQNSVINLPIDFVSNGKPTGVYQYDNPRKPSKRKDTTPSKLRKGPYTFNGRPMSLYILGPNGEQTRRQPIIYSDVDSNNIY
ncbi:uncharacterized protein [Fopius arisanus]|uniref:MRC1_1 protein n=1 Tax=Fopius arisanus TaxID=64838 RepID=A0A0C9PIP7_9HYME|nr:PREDICTED: uncharacterized protein LOC105271295 [Fopius arisanus]